jgi:hypothetical protein
MQAIREVVQEANATHEEKDRLLLGLDCHTYVARRL